MAGPDLAEQPQRSGPRSTRASAIPVEKSVCLADPLSRVKTASGEHDATLHKHLFHRQIYGRQLLLSVDDDPINQMVVTNLLQPMGCRVQQAMNGHEALAALEQATALPDLVLLDCMMPGMSGYSVCQYMRSRYGAFMRQRIQGIALCRGQRALIRMHARNSVGQAHWALLKACMLVRLCSR